MCIRDRPEAVGKLAQPAIEHAADATGAEQSTKAPEKASTITLRSGASLARLRSWRLPRLRLAAPAEPLRDLVAILVAGDRNEPEKGG